MSEKNQKYRRSIERLMYVQAFHAWLMEEPPMWRIFAWRRWLARRPRYKADMWRYWR